MKKTEAREQEEAKAAEATKEEEAKAEAKAEEDAEEEAEEEAEAEAKAEVTEAAKSSMQVEHAKRDTFS